MFEQTQTSSCSSAESNNVCMHLRTHSAAILVYCHIVPESTVAVRETVLPIFGGSGLTEKDFTVKMLSPESVCAQEYVMSQVANLRLASYVLGQTS